MRGNGWYLNVTAERDDNMLCSVWYSLLLLTIAFTTPMKYTFDCQKTTYP